MERRKFLTGAALAGTATTLAAPAIRAIAGGDGYRIHLASGFSGFGLASATLGGTDTRADRW